MFFRKILVTKNLTDKRRRRCITVFCQSFCLTVPKILEGEPFCGPEKIRVSKNFTHKKWISFICAIKFLSHRVQKFRRGTRLCFRKIRVWEIFMDKRRGGCITNFCQCFCLTVPKKFVGQPFCVSENFVYRNILWIREEGCVSRFLSNSVSDSTKKNRRATLLCFRKNRVSKNLRIIRGLHYFLLIIFCLTLPKILVGEPFCFRKKRVSKNLMHKHGIWLISIEKFCASQCL